MAQCKRHPKVETNLRCGKCDDPICPRCMVQTPVGARCPTCARVSRLPTFQISGIYLLRAIGAAVGAGVLCGLAWGFIQSYLFFYLSFLIGAAIGYGIGESISLAVNRKRGTVLAVIGGIAVVLAYVVSDFTFWAHGFQPFDMIAVIVGIFVSTSRLR